MVLPSKARKANALAVVLVFLLVSVTVEAARVSGGSNSDKLKRIGDDCSGRGVFDSVSSSCSNSEYVVDGLERFKLELRCYSKKDPSRRASLGEAGTCLIAKGKRCMEGEGGDFKESGCRGGALCRGFPQYIDVKVTQLTWEQVAPPPADADPPVRSFCVKWNEDKLSKPWASCSSDSDCRPPFVSTENGTFKLELICQDTGYRGLYAPGIACKVPEGARCRQFQPGHPDSGYCASGLACVPEGPHKPFTADWKEPRDGNTDWCHAAQLDRGSWYRFGCNRLTMRCQEDPFHR